MPFLKVQAGFLSIGICLLVFMLIQISMSGQPYANIKSLKYLGQYEIPFGLHFKNTTVGGLSGIDYDAANKRYFLISDDKGINGAARFYTADIFIKHNSIDRVRFTTVKNLLQPNGKVYPNTKQDPGNTPDPEAIRYNPKTKQLTWSSEGERIINNNETVLENPAVTNISMNGNYISSYTLPGNLNVQVEEKGSRQNGSLEGLTFADNYTTLFVNAEEPLFEDGPRADTSDNKAWIRITQFDVAGRFPTKQFGYQLERVAHAPFPSNAFKINGLTDILSIGKNKLLSVERSFSSGRLDCTIKLFIVDLTRATDIKKIPSIKNNNNFIAATKTLLLDMDNLGIFIDNIEGVTFGPVLPNGHKTLLFVADNNFNPMAKSQLLLFEVNEL